MDPGRGWIPTHRLLLTRMGPPPTSPRQNAPAVTISARLSPRMTPSLQQGNQLLLLNATERCIQKEVWRLIEQQQPLLLLSFFSSSRKRFSSAHVPTGKHDLSRADVSRKGTPGSHPSQTALIAPFAAQFTYSLRGIHRTGMSLG